MHPRSYRALKNKRTTNIAVYVPDLEHIEQTIKDALNTSDLTECKNYLLSILDDVQVILLSEDIENYYEQKYRD